MSIGATVSRAVRTDTDSMYRNFFIVSLVKRTAALYAGLVINDKNDDDNFREDGR